LENKIKSKNMFSKILVLIFVSFFIILILIAVGGLIFYFYFWPSKEEGFVSEETYFSILKKEAIAFDLKEEYHYNLETAEVIIYPPDFENYQFGYFEVYNKKEKIYSSTPTYLVSDLLAFQYQENKYIIISDYSGGAHCCFEEYVFFLNKANELKLIAVLDLGNTHLSEDSLFIKNKALYLKIFDDRFAYFYTPFASSYFFVQYFKIAADQLILSNNDFPEEYLSEALRCEEELNQELEQEEKEELFEFYSPLLACLTTNYVLAGQEEEAWQKFDRYSRQVPLNYYTEIDLEQFKQELKEILELKPLLEETGN